VQEQYKNQCGKCYYCHIKVGQTYHVDHIIPLSKGGSNGPENLVISCPRCNHRKQDKLPHEWPEGGRLM
jgi:5-methylcytosine-specific restriction endonuclease McrA